MILYKEVKLLPTAFCLDVWVSEDLEGVQDTFMNMYGVDLSVVEATIDQLNCVGVIRSSKDSLFEGEDRIYMILETLDPAIMAHEVVHVCWYLSKYSRVELKFSSQEWHACMTETIMEECLDQKSYELYE